MKTIKIIAMILGIIIVSSMLVSAAKKEIALDLWESFEFKGVNMTLVASNPDSFILCVNNGRVLIDGDKNFNGMLFDVRQKKFNYVEFQIDLGDDDGGLCANNLCSNQKCVEQFVSECKTARDCKSDDSCLIGICGRGKCTYNENPKCSEESTTSTTLPAGAAVESTTTSTTTGLFVNMSNASASPAFGTEQFKKATLILFGFLLVLILVVLIVKRKSYGYWKRKQKYY
ncbi:MAG TPA: hypothetical protein VJJ21_02190 [Candidatus Nanoarchaeia archaeon]|nr:hypothetical protein [Candidatus Nanoarchaeia archaeon]